MRQPSKKQRHLATNIWECVTLSAYAQRLLAFVCKETQPREHVGASEGELRSSNTARSIWWQTAPAACYCFVWNFLSTVLCQALVIIVHNRMSHLPLAACGECLSGSSDVRRTHMAHFHSMRRIAFPHVCALQSGPLHKRDPLTGWLVVTFSAVCACSPRPSSIQVSKRGPAQVEYRLSFLQRFREKKLTQNQSWAENISFWGILTCNVGLQRHSSSTPSVPQNVVRNNMFAWTLWPLALFAPSVWRQIFFFSARGWCLTRLQELCSFITWILLQALMYRLKTCKNTLLSCSCCVIRAKNWVAKV